MATRILFVCLGNICRSPSAEGVFHALAAKAGLSVEIDSAGTAGWHVGKPPYESMQQAARARLYDISHLRARQFSPRDFAAFDLIIGMDPDNVAHMEALRPAGCETPVALFTDYAPECGVNHVPDPYYTRNFDAVLELIEAASRGLIARLQAV